MTDQGQPAVVLNDGQSMPQFGLGVFQTPPEITAEIVRQAVDVGYRAVDTAAAYRNEEGVGEALRGHDDVFVTTKLWNADHGFDEALRAFEESARKLRRRTLDLYLIHWPRPRFNRYVESWKALVRLKSEGRARSIGVSNFNRDHLERIIGETGFTPAVNQIELHPRFQQKALRAFHGEHGIRTESWSPLGRGSLLSDPAIVGIAAKHGKTPAQVVIRWHLDSGLIVIPKTVRLERLKENIGALGFRLDGDDMRRIEALELARRADRPRPRHRGVLRPGQTKRSRAPSSGTPVSSVVHVSPAATGKARVSVPVVTISPAASGGLTGSAASNSTRWRSAKTGPSRTLAARPWSAKTPLRKRSISKAESSGPQSSERPATA